MHLKCDSVPRTRLKSSRHFVSSCPNISNFIFYILYAIFIIYFTALSMSIIPSFPNSHSPHANLYNYPRHNLLGSQYLTLVKLFCSILWYHVLKRLISTVRYSRQYELSQFSLHQVFKTYFRIKKRSTKFMLCSIVWIYLLNFLSLSIVNPSLLNPDPDKTLSVLYQNVQGLVPFGDLRNPNPQLNVTKLFELQSYVSKFKPDIVILNETWLKSSILDAEIFPNNSYKVFRQDRSAKSHPIDDKNPRKYKKQGGDVVIAFRSDLDVKTTKFKIKGDPAKAEILSVVLTSGFGSKVCISTLYRVGTLGAENLVEVDRHLKSIAKSNSIHKHILVGDFNLNKTSWPDAQSSCSTESGFVELFHQLGFDQLISAPTHKAGNILDLLLCNQPHILSEIETLHRNTICNSDHYGIKFKIKINCKRLKSPKRRIYNLKKADFKSLNAELCRVPWRNILINCDIDDVLHNFESIFCSLCDRFIPKVTVKSSFQPPWFDSELDAICRRKNKLLDKFKQTNDPNVQEEIKKIRKKFKTVATKKKRDNVLNDDDPALIKKKFWSFFKSTSNSCRIPETVNYGNKFRSQNFDVANLFNKYFSDQFSSPSRYDIDIKFGNDPFHDICFDEKLVFDLLRKMNANKLIRLLDQMGFKVNYLNHVPEALQLP